MDPQREPESRKKQFFNDVFASTISNRFFIDFSCQLAPLETQKSLIFYCFFKVFFFLIAYWSWHRFRTRFWCQLGSILVSQIDQNSIKKRSQKQSFFWSISASIFDPFWVHFGSQVGAMLGSEIHSKSIKIRSGTVLVPPKPPGSLRSLPGTDFGWIFDWFFNDFGWIFDRFFDHFFLVSSQARWRVRSFAARWIIRTGPEGAQLRVWVRCNSVCRFSEFFCSKCFFSLKIRWLPGAKQSCGPPLEPGPRVDIFASKTNKNRFKSPL